MNYFRSSPPKCLPPPQAIQPVMSMPVRRLKFETKACVVINVFFFNMPVKRSYRVLPPSWKISRQAFPFVSHQF
jgi:hypothetical protein